MAADRNTAKGAALPEDLLQAMCGYFLLWGESQMSLALETAFYAVLRTGELLSCVLVTFP